MIYYERPDYVEFFRRATKFRSMELEMPVENTPEQSISVCTTCMNRLHDLKLTLPRNLEDCSDYQKAQFILLDYSSQDNLGNWVRENMGSYLETGRLIYYRTEGYTHFRSSHPRNITFRLSQGDIVTNVDADNYVKTGFLQAINRCMSLGRVVAVPYQFLRPESDRMLLRGRFAMYREDLFELGGFDEYLDEAGGYSNEDVDLIFRALLSGYFFVRFPEQHLEDRIETPIGDRIALMNIEQSFEKVKALNMKLIGRKLGRLQTVCNVGRRWGHAVLTKNFTERIEI